MKLIASIAALTVLLLVLWVLGEGGQPAVVEPTSVGDVGSTTETARDQPSVLRGQALPRGLDAIAKIKANVGSSATREHVEALTGMGVRAIPVIMSEVRASTDRSWHHYVITAITRMGPVAIPSLSSSLGDPNKDVRLVAALSLFDLGKEHVGALQALQRSRADSYGKVAYLAEMAHRKLTGTLWETYPEHRAGEEFTIPPVGQDTRK